MARKRSGEWGGQWEFPWRFVEFTRDGESGDKLTNPFYDSIVSAGNMSLTHFSDDQLEEYLEFLDRENTYLVGLIESLNAVRTPETRGRARGRSQSASPRLVSYVQDIVMDSDEDDDDSDAWMEDSDDDVGDMDDIATVGYWSYPDLVPIDSDYESDDDDTDTVIYPWEDPTVTP
jgi:hypothetical protein